MSAGIRIDAKDLAVIESRFKNFFLKFKDRKDILEKIGFILENSARNRIESTKRDPEGVPWAPWSESYAKTRNGNQSLLMSRGQMLKRLSYRVTTSTTVEVGSRMKYSGYMQDGTKKIPARPFLGMSTDDANDILIAIEAWAGRIRDKS
jgi:phage virion morphogenesis protein